MKKNAENPARRIHVLNKFFLIMKFTTIMLIISMLNIYAKGYSQNEKLTMHLENVSMRQIISNLEKQSDYKFLYNDDFSGLDKVVSLNAEKMTIIEILDKIFDNTEVACKILDNKLIVIIPRNYLSGQ